MAAKHISHRKIENLIVKTFFNALRLHFDAILLFKNESYPSAYALSVLSLEEHGKVLTLEHFIYTNRGNGRGSPEDEEKFIKYIYNHRFKQNEFARHTHGVPHLAKGIMKDLWSGAIETHKQNAIYVGLSKKNNKFDPQGKILSPTRISKAKSSKQITLVNDHIIKRMAMYVKGCDFPEVDKLCHEFTHERIALFRHIWPQMDTATMKEFIHIMKFPDSEDL